jgi:hypothetical protein
MNLAKTRLGLAVWLILALLTTTFYSPFTANAAPQFAAPAFENIYNRLDGEAVRDASRPYFWGEDSLAIKTERWDTAPDQQRLVQFFPKGKMELNAIPGGAPIVTFGRLAHDLATGAYMVSDDRLQAYEPSRRPVHGDNSLTNPAPRYTDFANDVFSTVATPSVGGVITRAIRSGRQLGLRSPTAQPVVRNAYYEIRTGHNIAEPFWAFFNAKGNVGNANGQVSDALMFSWEELVGYPLSDPYWMNFTQDGKTTEALVQLFERRVMLFIPSAPDGLKVQFNEVGRHYVSWAYDPYPGIGNQPTDAPTGKNGKVEPQYGGENTIFRLVSTGFKPGEVVNFQVIQPDGKAYNTRPFRLGRADQLGQAGTFFYGYYFTSFTNPLPGIYQMNLVGVESGKTAEVYYRLIDLPPETPTKPYTIPSEPVPPSINAVIEPNSGGVTTDFIAVLEGLYFKDFTTPEGRNNLAIWVTDPDGVVYSEFALSDLAGIQESPFGAVLLIGAPPAPGVWAVTFQVINNPNKKAIVYLRVTDEPYEISVNLAFAFNRVGSTFKGTGLFKKLPFVEVERPAPEQPPTE